MQLARIPLLNRRSCDFVSTDITSVTDVASEQRCVVVFVVVDAFVIVLGLQMFTKSSVSIPCNGLDFSGEGRCSVNTGIQICFILLPCQHLIHGGIQLSCFELTWSCTRILYKMNEGEEKRATTYY